MRALYLSVFLALSFFADTFEAKAQAVEPPPSVSVNITLSRMSGPPLTEQDDDVIREKLHALRALCENLDIEAWALCYTDAVTASVRSGDMGTNLYLNIKITYSDEEG